MSKLVIFDLDGVIIDSKNIHFNALNDALSRVGDKFIIPYEEHLTTYDGLNTKTKLELLTKLKGLPAVWYNQIFQDKQRATLECIRTATINPDIVKIVKSLKIHGWFVAVASNSIRETVIMSLRSAGLLYLVDFYIGNDEVTYPKPYPEMYWRCMEAVKALPSMTVIVEDSHIGRQGAIDSKAILYPVRDAYSLEYNSFMDYIATRETPSNAKWSDDKLNVLIPMAGAGSRFVQAGYTFPKPLIEIRGKPMIQVVVENLNIKANYIFIVQREHYEKYNLNYLLQLIAPNCQIIPVDGVTEGAACTALLAESLIDSDKPLLIANSDQYIEWNSCETMYSLSSGKTDAGILTFKSTHPKWSYVRLDESGFVSEVAEKKVISDRATVGIYYWSKGSDYCKYARQMIQKNIRVNGEFYVCPVFNEAILDNKKIRTLDVSRMWGIGTPEDLETYHNEYKNSKSLILEYME